MLQNYTISTQCQYSTDHQHFNFLQLHQGNQNLTKEKKMEEKRKIQQSSNDFEMSSLFVPMSRMNNCQLGGYGPQEKNPEKNPRYKTEICRNFKERSNCIYGKKCQFAHGRQELCDVRKSKYKTKPCQKYWQVGYCAYGPRCNFLHGEINDFDQEMMDLNTTITRGDSTHYDPTLSSTSRPITPTNLFDFELGNILFLLKFIYSEKATKFDEIFNLPLSFYVSI